MSPFNSITSRSFLTQDLLYGRLKETFKQSRFLGLRWRQMPKSNWSESIFLGILLSANEMACFAKPIAMNVRVDADYVHLSEDHTVWRVEYQVDTKNRL